jgi:DNA-binding NarL/FixJ family response regulator
MTRIPTYVYGDDPVVEAGVAAQLRRSAVVEVLEEDDIDRARVAVVALERVTDESLRVVRALRRQAGPETDPGRSGPAVVVVVGDCEEAEIVEAVAAGISGLLRRSDASPSQLAVAVQAAAAGQGCLPPDMLGRLFDQVVRLRDTASGAVSPVAGLDERELTVLRLVADGFDTRQIADSLAYSERTIKGILQEVTRRLGLRNRSHAVAYAVRQGLIQ